MDTTIITVIGTGVAGAVAVMGLVSRSIGNLRSHMDQRIDSLIHANQQAHDTIGMRIDTQGKELRERIDAQSAQIDAQSKELRERIDAQSARIDAQGKELSGRIDTLAVRLAKTNEDVAFIKGKLVADAAA